MAPEVMNKSNLLEMIYCSHKEFCELMTNGMDFRIVCYFTNFKYQKLNEIKRKTTEERQSREAKKEVQKKN